MRFLTLRRAVFDRYARLKTFWQRGRRGWADQDTYDLTNYLASWLPDAIRHLERRDIGVHPIYMEQSWAEVGGSYDRVLFGKKDPRSAGRLQRGGVLQAEAREQMAKAWEEWRWSLDQGDMSEQEGMRLFFEHLESLWW